MSFAGRQARWDSYLLEGDLTAELLEHTITDHNFLVAEAKDGVRTHLRGVCALIALQVFPLPTTNRQE